MEDQQRKLVKAATRMHERLLRCRWAIPNHALPEREWSACMKTRRLLRLAALRQWRAAAGDLKDQLAIQLRDLRYELDRLEADVLRPEQDLEIPSPHQIHDDLVVLDQEFDGLQVDLKRQTLSVQTEPIVLDEIDLGRFEIELDWSDLGGTGGYEVKALDPYPAKADSDVVHPHVRQNSLCEGDGQAPIRKALQQGRLLDFFLLVRQILDTYNPESAYASLDRWDNSLSCGDCGDGMSEDDSTCCGRCGRDLCGECISSCYGCDDYRCSDCLTQCKSCEDWFCSGCLSSCEGCEKQVCNGCLTDDLCPECLEQRKEEQDVEEPETAVAAAAVHAVCVEQAAVPA